MNPESTNKTQKTNATTSKTPKLVNSQLKEATTEATTTAKTTITAKALSSSSSLRRKAQPIKLAGFCDIVNQAALKKGKTVGKQATMKSIKTATKTNTAMTSVTSNESKRADKWEEFREKKMAEMKQHKINVERRMQTSRNIDGQMYWSQRADKLKRYPKHEALHPTWYTENIYSNNSIDLETDDFFCVDNQYGSNDYDREQFQRKKAHAHNGYGYPKSRSCCFGSGYEERPKPALMPKSSSFTSNRGMSNFRTMYSSVEEKSFVEVHRQNNHNHRNNVNRSGLRKFYCWENDGQPIGDKHDLYNATASNVRHFDENNYSKTAEIYQIERDRNYCKSPNIDMHDVHATTNTNYIRNIWQNRNQSSSLYKVQNVNEINGNYLNELNSMPYNRRHQECMDGPQPFEEEYLIIHENKPNINIYSARNSFDDPGSVSRRQSVHSNEIYSSELDPYSGKCSYMNRDKIKKGIDVTLAYLTSRELSHHRSKSMLEVKPPNRYDDTSSESTIDDLYDFNFDFTNQFDLDYRNNNTTKCDPTSFKRKHINIDDYSKYRKSNIDNMDDTDNDLNDVDFDDPISQSDEDDCDEDINYNNLTSPRHDQARYQSPSNNEFVLSNRSAYDRFYDNCMSPTEFYPAASDSNNRNHLSPNRDSVVSKDHHHHHHHQQQQQQQISQTHQINNIDMGDNKVFNNNNNNVDPIDDGNENLCGQENSGNILFNNIFSIYKPRKYSPVSCHAAGSQKVCGQAKSMNVPSTVRPLGAPYNDFLTSMKRPLTITPSCFTTQKRNWIVPSSATMDQAHFKIIPEKTGLKISPLYRFGYEDDSKLRLKCTARPLLFPL